MDTNIHDDAGLDPVETGTPLTPEEQAYQLASMILEGCQNRKERRERIGNFRRNLRKLKRQNARG